MNFALSEQQAELQESLGRMIRVVCDLRGVHAAIDGEAAFDDRLWRQLLEFGAASTCIGTEYGGLGLEMIDLALIAEVLGYHAAPVPFLGHALAGIAIARAGSAEQKSKWLPKLVSGEVLATVALGEGNAVWLPEQWTLPAGKPAGVKSNVPNANEADLFVVGLAGGELGLVGAGATGMTRTPLEGVDRTRRLGEIQFDGAALELLPLGKDQSAAVRDAALVLLAADAFGGARRCLDMAVAYAKEREQFGVKIASFQALRHQLANTAIETEPMRGLYWYAAHAWDHLPERAAYAAALAKAHLADRYQQVARDAVEAHGGIGYTWEYDIHILLKRAMFDYAFMGAPAVHRARVADMAGW